MRIQLRQVATSAEKQATGHMTALTLPNPTIPIPEELEQRIQTLPPQQVVTSADDLATGHVTAPTPLNRINQISKIHHLPPRTLLQISFLDPKSPRKYPKPEPDPSSLPSFSSPMMVSATSSATSLAPLGTEVTVTSDLGNLIGLYRDWHKHLIPYYSFDQFVHNVDKVASSKRVKNCIRELRERVARGGDPTKLHESPDEFNGPNEEQGARPLEGQTHDHYEGDHVDDVQETMLNEIYQKVSEEPSPEIRTDIVAAEVLAGGTSGPEHQVPNNGAGCSSEVQITEEQRARMEANKLKALEKAAAGSSSEIRISEEQRARMEANRLKAQERAAARARSLQA
ncbi:hypothetical protein REPUB_Repub04eG0225900 [Reevesia pubescens]